MPRTLSAQEVSQLGLEDSASAAPRTLSPDEVSKLGLESDAPEPSAPQEEGTFSRVVRFLTTPPPTTDQYAAFLKRANPPDAITNDSPDWKAAIGEAAKSMPGLVPNLGGDERLARFEREHPNIALALGFAGPGGIKKPAGLATVAGEGGGVLNKLRAWSKRLTQEMTDKAAKAADETARSAGGTLGAVTREGSSTLRDLSRTEALPASEIAANRAALATPEAQALATDLAGNYRDKLPGLLNQRQNARALAQQTAQDAADARLPENVRAYADKLLKGRTREQLKRYALPIAGAAYGALSGEGDWEERASKGTLYGLATAGLAGRALSPTFNAVVGNNLLAPERMYKIAPTIVSAAEKISNLPVATLGRFARPLQLAAQRGPNAVIATHYKLQTDPEYQELARKAEETNQ